ncbi:carboxymuconolactone decarboxylase family protein [Spirillospora sp. NPDC029432]|uniref:carboxymuconolactone decarboxylase family protein n=1 Tax=Spirillospora sp. NPDC029432 TaxID=3154599 RepID=UPI00345626C6
MDERRRRGLDMMGRVYGWEVGDGHGDFFALTADHLFGEIWTRPGLSLRDRRLLLIGMLAGQGLNDVLDIQIPAALANGEVSADELREIGIFLLHYVGWPLGSKLCVQIDTLIAKHERAQRKKEKETEAKEGEAGGAGQAG